MKLRYFILFFVVFEIMQILDIVLTQHALLTTGHTELNPFYKYDWFINSKLLMPFFTTLCFMASNYHCDDKYIINAMHIILAIYVFVIFNNLFAVLW